MTWKCDKHGDRDNEFCLACNKLVDCEHDMEYGRQWVELDYDNGTRSHKFEYNICNTCGEIEAL